MTKDKIYEMLTALNIKMKAAPEDFGFSGKETYSAIETLQKQGFIDGVAIAKGGQDRTPKIIWLENAYVTAQGLNFIDEYEKVRVDLTQEIVSACSKLADNPVSYCGFDENALNREIRNFLDAAITRFGYSICDQTQQGFSGKEPGELDIRITQGGIPTAIFEGLIHKDKEYIYSHIDKAIDKYNQSGCKSIYIVEYSRNKNFLIFWNNATNNINLYSRIESSEIVDTGLLGVRLIKGKYKWQDDIGDIYYIGVNCTKPSVK